MNKKFGINKTLIPIMKIKTSISNPLRGTMVSFNKFCPTKINRKEFIDLKNKSTIKKIRNSIVKHMDGLFKVDVDIFKFDDIDMLFDRAKTVVNDIGKENVDNVFIDIKHQKININYEIDINEESYKN